MGHHIQALYSHRELLWMWTLREIKIRYKQSVLGITWALLQPLVLIGIFTLVFSLFTRVDTGSIPYPVFSLTGVLPWLFFSTSISFAVPSLVNNLNLVSKIYFPREVLPMASVLAAFVDFLIECIVFLVMMVVYQMPLHATMLWVPVLLIFEVLLTIGIVLTLSAFNVWFRDIRFVVPLALQIWMYACPIIYPVSLVPDWLRPFYMLNPMATIIDSFQRVILYNQPPQFIYLGVCALLIVLLLTIGYSYFKRTEVQFADVI